LGVVLTLLSTDIYVTLITIFRPVFFSPSVVVRMEEDQETNSSSDEQGLIIEDEDIEDSPTDTPELWMPDRDEQDKSL